MIHPINKLGRSFFQSKTLVRSKFISLDETGDKTFKLKKWHKENRVLFGPLLETSKQKRKKQSFAKNSDISHLSIENSAVENGALIENKTLQAEKSVMFPNMKNSVTLLSAKVLSNGGSKGFHTCVASLVKQSASPEAPPSAAEERILQIKPYKNDYSQEYPAVTLILNKTMSDESKAALEKWKRERIAEMGLAEFNKFYQAQMAVGTKFHDTLKRFFTQPSHKLQIEKDVEGVWVSVEEVLKDVTSPRAIESNVVHPVLKYRGIFDAIADYHDKPTLIEWKKSDRPRKSIALTYDNPTQLAAYFGAVSNDLNYKHLNVKNALLVIAYTDGSKADAFHFSMDQMREHWAHWITRLDDYFTHHASDSEKRLKGGKTRFAEETLF